MEKYIEIENNFAPLRLADIPVLDYPAFQSLIDDLFRDESSCHCLNYFAVPGKDYYQFYCCIGLDEVKKILVFSHELKKLPSPSLDSLTIKHLQFHIFEREIHENYGIEFKGHPWLKPVRYPFNRADLNCNPENYPFYHIQSRELHEVGVGPVHAGIIEPGYFRFICNGENVLHLEIQLGYQHRGIEQLFIESRNFLKNILLAENIAGDTVTGHTLCHALLMRIIVQS